MLRSLLTFAAAGLLATLAPVAMSAADTPPAIYLAGDSTMCNYKTEGGNPQRGWGMFLEENFQEGVKVHNRAAGGRSTKSFRDEGRWDKIMADIKPGDWVIIQFGHNDQKKEKPEVYAAADTDYKTNLANFIRETREKGASPILATSIYRLFFKEDGKEPKPTLGDYPQAARDVAKELDVPLIDLNEATRLKLVELGPEGSKPIYLHFEPGENAAFPEGKHDNTHLSEMGGKLYAGLFVQGLREQKVPLAQWLKPAP